MRRNNIHIEAVNSKVIKVDFRRERLTIDDDPYLENVTEIHCRSCNKRRPRRGAIELTHTWGYLCAECRKKKTAAPFSSAERKYTPLGSQIRPENRM